MKRFTNSLFVLSMFAALLVALPASAQPLLQWNFDDADAGSQDVLDNGVAPAENGIFKGGATRTSNTPGGASTGAADLFVGAAGTDAYIQATETASLDALTAITITAWINFQADPVGNDRIAALQATNSPPNADFNNSGLVDNTDLAAWQSGYGINDGLAGKADGDANSDGNVLGDDFFVWQGQFGGPAGPPFGDFAGFSLNINAPLEGSYTADDFRLGMFIGGVDDSSNPVFDFERSADIEGLGGEWVFVATTFDGTTGDLSFFTGTEGSAASQSGATAVLEPFAIEKTFGNFYVGKTEAAVAANTSLEGFIDDVRIYDSALSLAELDTVRLENLATGLQAVPEPAGAALLLLTASLVAAARRQ